MSTLMRRVHHVSLVAPYELCRVGDHGDTPVNPIDLMDSLKRIEAFYAGCTPPARRHCRPAATIWSRCRSCARSPASGRSGLVHFDAHSDTSDSYFGGEKYTHGTPFRRAVEEG